jgi:hypothetical protein
MFAELKHPADAAKRAAHDLRFKTLPQKTVLHLQANRAAQRIEAKDRIVGEDVGAVDCLWRNEIPIDGVAKNLVDADPVFIDGEALWRAQTRRGDKAPEGQCLREWIAVAIDRNRGGGPVAAMCRSR